ncbi:MAG TPA: OmpA family protein [Chitinophaga sp.]|uniref:OmpA family protein n=1 Tax=Chitinophaga sp. TaxID=1869181 RepID=UPI002F91FAF8
MKKLFVIGTACMLTCTVVKAQLFDRIKNKMEQKANDAIDKTIDNAGKKKDKKKSGESSPESTDSGNTGTTTTTNNEGSTGAATASNMDITSYSKFDFVPGAKIIMDEDFSQEAIGDFPAQWNTRTGAEVVTVNNRPGKWLGIKQEGTFYPEYLTSNFPDNFTLQMDVMANNGIASIAQLTITLLQAKDADEKFDYGTSSNTSSVPNFKVGLNPKSSGYGNMNYSSNVIGSHNISATPEFSVPKKNTVRVSIWRQKQRIRLYLDSTKTLDLPRALDANAVLNSLVFNAYAPDYGREGGTFFISNIRLAVGAPDTRNKLITEGKFVTHGILFDVNSDKIQAASYGSLQDIANVLKENAGVRVKIVGHTDANGDDQLNQDLSKRRAAAVKEALSKNFGIDAARMDTDGKGKAQPIDDNNTAAGRANNRRVEFIKL